MAAGIAGNVFAGVNGGAMTTTVSSAGSQQCLVLVEVITGIARLQVGSGGRFDSIPEELIGATKISNPH